MAAPNCAAAPPPRPPSLLEDLGVVGAVSLRRDLVSWTAGAALLASTAWWAPTSVAIGWYVVIALLAVPYPLLPRWMLGSIPAAAAACGVGLTLGLLSDWGGLESRGSLVAVCTGQAMAIPWAAAVGRSRRVRPSETDAEAASARLSVWVQEHPWLVAMVVLSLVGPGGALWMQGWVAAARAGEGRFPDGLMVPLCFSPGALLFVAAALGRSVLRAAEVSVVGLAAAGVLWAGLSYVDYISLTSRPIPPDMFDTVLHVGGVTLVCQIAAIGMLRSRFGFERRPAEAAAFVAACLTVEVLGLLLVVRLDLSGFGPGKLGVWAAVLLRDATLLAILFAAARSALRGRTIVVACIAYTGLVSLVAALLAEQEAHSLRCAGVAALGGLAQAFFVLAARRVRSLTVVPADHPLRADWAVDLAQARRIPGPG